jgi:hypothetical protein
VLYVTAQTGTMHAQITYGNPPSRKEIAVVSETHRSHNERDLLVTVVAIREARGCWDELDWDNVADEMESLGFRNKRKTEQHLSWLVTQLTLWWTRPERRCGKWASRILERRFKLADILDDSPSLRDGLSDVFAEFVARSCREGPT